MTNHSVVSMDKEKQGTGKVNVTFRAGRGQVKLLDELAKHFDRDRSYLVNEAVEEYLALRQWQIDEVKLALEEVEAGKFLTEEEFLCDAKRWDA